MSVERPDSILDPGFCLTLRPMKYPELYDMYKNSTRNIWTVQEVDLSVDINDLNKMSSSERHLIKRLVAFFATGDSIVSNNLVLNLYKHINSPEARMYLSRQLAEEALHIEQYLTILDTYIPNADERHQAFMAVEKIPSIKTKADFCFKWIDRINNIEQLDTSDKRRQFLLNLICFASCIEGLFFFGAFAYVYFLRSKGLLHGLSSATNLIFKDETAHMMFAFKIIDIVKTEEPKLFDDKLKEDVVAMINDAIECEMQFADDLLSHGIVGFSSKDMRTYLEYIADQRFAVLGIDKQYNVRNPFDFLALQDVQELTNFFERRVSSYQTGIEGEVAFDINF